LSQIFPASSSDSRSAPQNKSGKDFAHSVLYCSWEEVFCFRSFLLFYFVFASVLFFPGFFDIKTDAQRLRDVISLWRTATRASAGVDCLRD
jgi:hypothetical protein